MIALGSADDLENEIEQIKDTINNIQVSSQSPEKDHEVDFSQVPIPKKPKEEKQSRANVMTQILEGEIARVKKEYDLRFESLEKKLLEQVSKANRSNFDTFLDLKDDNLLFEGTNHPKRIEEAKGITGSGSQNKNVRNKIVQNEMVLYQLYGRYKQMVAELDTYKNKIMDNLWFGEKHTDIFIKNPKLRKRSNSLEFKVFNIQDD